MGPLRFGFMVLAISAGGAMPCVACSSSSSNGDAGSGSSSGGSASCHPGPGTYTITITASASNPAYCQSGSELGSGNTFTYPYETGGLAPGCTCTGAVEICSKPNIPCGAGCTFTQNQDLTWTTTGYSGTETVVYGDGGTCNYTLTAM